ncbi:GIY-YIG nuclease family protein [Bacillus thuringiensis]|uniref:GIY-YIG nuclease family protein n=1 Tax=Bacillus thuringiensis TaxID=1428 RepID=UPI002FFE4C22
MFGTIIQDAYTKDETEQMADALEDICNSHHEYGWSSAGIYCFWNYTTKEVLYIGLAVDLLTRFKQHNGIIQTDPASCKYEKIQEHFETNDKIGYSVFLQSTHFQPVHRGNRNEWIGFEPTQFSYTQDSLADMRLTEGILIQTYRLHHESLPPWNRIGGERAGQDVAIPGNYIFVQSLTHQNISPFIAKHTIREISSDPTYLFYEEELHSVRMSMGLGSNFDDALETYRVHNEPNYNRIIGDNYLNHQLNF